MKQTKYYVYMTQNVLNRKIYVGYHASDDIENDSYLGSGILLIKAINRYGKQNFKRYILYQFDNSYHALNMEREIVNQQFLKRDDVYNVALGGLEGGGKSNSGKAVVKDEFGNILVINKDDSEYLQGELVGVTKNTIWINNGENQKTISKQQIIPEGWKKGRITIKNSKKITNGIVERFLNEGDIIPEGFFQGRLTKNGKWINNGKIEKQLLQKESLPIGWSYGRISQTNDGFQWIYNSFTNQEKMKRIEEPLEEGWCLGRIKRIHINNGVEQIRIKQTQEIPQGYKVGGLVGKKKRIKNIITGKERYIGIKEEIPQGWSDDNLSRPTVKGSFFVTDGFTNKLIKKGQIIPKGFYKGGIPHKDKGSTMIIKNQKIKQERVINIEGTIPNGWQKGMLNRIWISDGTNLKKIIEGSELPIGWKQIQGVKWVNDGKNQQKYIDKNETIHDGWFPNMIKK